MVARVYRLHPREMYEPRFFPFTSYIAAKQSRPIVFAAAEGQSESGDCAEHTQRVRRFSSTRAALCTRESCFAFGGTGIAAALRVALRVSGDFDLEELLQVGHALIEFVADVDILAITEQRTIRLGASSRASTGEHGLAIDLAAHIDVGFARPRTGSFAFCGAIGAGRRRRTLCIALGTARRFASRAARVRVPRAGTRRAAACIAIGATRSLAIERGGIDHAARVARSFAARRTHDRGGDVAADIALSREVDGFARSRAAPRDTHFTVRAGADIDSARGNEVGVRWRSEAQKRGRQGNSEDGGKDFTHGVVLLILWISGRSASTPRHMPFPPPMQGRTRSGTAGTK